MNISLSESGAMATSPITGTIVRWRLVGAKAIPGYAIRVLRAAGGTSYTGGVVGPSETPSGPTEQTFTSALPIQAGELVGLNVPAGGAIGVSVVASSRYGGYEPALPLGATLPSLGPFPDEAAFNAEVQPPPGITGISSPTGSIKGGMSVVITGHDFTGASAVKFGSLSAASFTVNSDTQVTAVAPPSTAPGAIDTSVTTAAGTTPASSADQFTYTACVVPKLKGKKLKALGKALKKAECKLGKVQGNKSKTAKVKTQSPKSGTVLTPGSKVNVKVK